MRCQTERGGMRGRETSVRGTEVHSREASSKSSVRRWQRSARGDCKVSRFEDKIRVALSAWPLCRTGSRPLSCSSTPLVPFQAIEIFRKPLKASDLRDTLAPKLANPLDPSRVVTGLSVRLADK